MKKQTKIIILSGLFAIIFAVSSVVGKYNYTGRVIGKDKDPVEAATVLLLTSKDSTLLTYGITSEKGYFSIPCDRKSVIAKISCIICKH